MIVIIDKRKLRGRRNPPTRDKSLEELELDDLMDGLHLTLDGIQVATLILVIDPDVKKFRCFKDLNGAFNTEIIYHADLLKQLLGNYPEWIWFGMSFDREEEND